MTITYCFYKSPRDLQRQIDFWIAATNQLPFAWKPTLSPDEHVPLKDSLKRLGFTQLTEDIMMMKKSDPTE
jgi:hypothetical protein